ncbi:MAG: hypothetical protein ACMUIS_10620 [bacterium]
MKGSSAPAGLVGIDCEGPLTKNDNALELATHFIPRGDRLFTQLSRYDDILASMVKRPGYRAGNTLKLICPFLRAFGVGNRAVIDFSAHHILIMPGADMLLQWITRHGDGFIISTSYRPYISALCDAVGFPIRNTYCTDLDLEMVTPSEGECREVRAMAEGIIALPSLDWEPDVTAIEGLSTEVQDAYTAIDRMIMSALPQTTLGCLLERVEPVGGEEKAKAVSDSCRRTGRDIAQVIYIGDSITDVEAFRLVRQGGGMTVAFNGNRYALENAEVACLAHHADILAIICQAFWERGRPGVDELIAEWNSGSFSMDRVASDDTLGDAFATREHHQPSSMTFITDKNRPSLIRESETFRRQVRGEEIGRLG